MLKLDYSLESPEERKKLVEQIIAESETLTPMYLETLADYLVLCMEKQERKEKRLLTTNRMATVNKRETSFEGLVSQLENGEDSIYGLITENKNVIFKPKALITKEDIENVPTIKEIREGIEYWKNRLKTASGKNAYIIKSAIIDLGKDQYVLKNDYYKPVTPTKLTRSKAIIQLDDSYYLDENKDIVSTGVSFCNPKICSTILCNYSALKQDGAGDFEKDLWFFMEDFDKVAEDALKDYPLYERIVEYKIDGLQNTEIQQKIQEEFGIKHSLEYISSLWRNKIPRLIAQKAEEQLLDWHYLTQEKGQYKRCGRCGEIKLAHNKYFSKNKTSRDGFYSICKECRNKNGQK